MGRRQREARQLTVHEAAGVEPATRLAPVVDVVEQSPAARALAELVERATSENGVDALAAVRQLEAMTGRLAKGAATRARRQRATWQEIGDALGMTRQAAHLRYARKPARRP